MPSGAKKRKALKKKELEAFGASPSNKGVNGHGHDEHGSQDEGESDGNLSSPGSQGNGEFWTRGPSPSPLSGLGKDTVKHKTEDAGQEENGVEDKPPKPFSENVTHNTSKVPCKESAGTLETGPADDFVSKVVIPDKNKQVEISDSVQHNSDESEEKHKPEEAKEGSIPGSAAETSRDLKIVRECSEEKALEDNYRQVLAKTYLATVDS